MEWIKDLRDEFDACSDIKSLMEKSSLLWEMRRFDGVKLYSVAAWKARAKRLNPAADKKKVVVVDLPSVAHAGWHTNPSDLPNLITLMLRNIYRSTSPDVFILATDCRQGSHRYSHPSYKHKRKPTPDEFYKLYDTALAQLKEKGLQIEEHEGMESDDILTSAAFRASLLGQACILVTEDKDLWQALAPKVVIYSRKKNEYFNADRLLATHKITPSQVVDWLCIVGGKNDMPGVKGAAEKKASEWLEAYGDFVGLVDNAESLTRAKRDAVMEYYEKHYWEVREVHTLSRAVNVLWQ